MDNITTFDELMHEATAEIITVELPDGSEKKFRFRIPTLADIWQIERDMPPQPQPPGEWAKVNGKPEFREKPNDPGYVAKMAEWLALLEHRRIVAWWDTDIPGDTTDEQVENVRKRLNAATMKALSACVRHVTGRGEVAIKERSFQSSETPGHANMS
jgi:hypothetical protein